MRAAERLWSEEDGQKELAARGPGARAPANRIGFSMMSDEKTVTCH